MNKGVDNMINLDPKKSLPLLDEYIGRSIEPAFCAYASSVFVRRGKDYILLHQLKDNRVVGDNLVGIGGKNLLTNLYGSSEKIPMSTLASSMYAGKLSGEHDIKDVAVREVLEETGGFKKDDNTTPSGYGLLLEPSKLQPVGTSSVRVLNSTTNSLWRIDYFVYDLDGSEGSISPEEQREGTFEVCSEEDLLSVPMLPADRMIVHNMLNNPGTTLDVEAIYNDLDNQHTVRGIFTTEENITHILVPDCDKLGEYVGEVVECSGAEEELLSALPNVDQELLRQLSQHFSKKQGWKFSYPERRNLLPPTSRYKK